MVVGSRDKKSWRGANSSERCKKTRSSWNDFSNRRNPPRSRIMWISRSTFLEREELRRDPFPLSRGQNENTGVPSPRYLVMASHYLSGQQPRESVLVTTVVFLERKASSKPAVRIYIYIYLYSSFFRINRLVKENIRDEGRRERERERTSIFLRNDSSKEK